MFDILVSFYPASKTKHDLGLEADMSPTSGSFGTYLRAPAEIKVSPIAVESYSSSHREKDGW